MGEQFLIISCNLVRGNNYFNNFSTNQTKNPFVFYLRASARNGDYSLYCKNNRLMFVSKANWIHSQYTELKNGCGFSINGKFQEYNFEFSWCHSYGDTWGTVPEFASALIGEDGFETITKDTLQYADVVVDSNTTTLFRRECKGVDNVSVTVSSSQDNTSGDGVYWNVSGSIVFTATPKNENYICRGFLDSEGNILTSSSTYSIPQNSYQDYLILPIVHSLYSVTYNANGGTGVMDSQSAEQGVMFTLRDNTLVRAGWAFTGWNTKPDGSGVSYANGASVIDLTQTAGGVVTLYAQWRKTSFSVVTSVSIENGAPEQNPSVELSPEAADGFLKEGTFVSVSAQNDNLLGIEFDLWNVSGITVGDVYANPLQFIMPSHDVLINAVYKLKAFTVTHGVDVFSKVATDGDTSITDNEGNAVDKLFYGDEVVFHAPTPKEGYYFSGWYNGNECVSQNQNHTVVLTGDVSLVARYSTIVWVMKSERDGGFGHLLVDGSLYEGVEHISLFKELGSTMCIGAVLTSGAFGGWYQGDALLELFQEDTVVVTSKYDHYTANLIAYPITVQVMCQSVTNSDTDDGALGTLALAGPGVTDNGNGLYSVEGFTEVVLTATQADGGLPLFRVTEEVAGVESAIDISKPIRILLSGRTFIARWGNKGKFQVQVSSADNAAGMAYIGESAAVTVLTGEQDSTVTITALPSNGYRFVGWYEGDRLVSGKARFSFALVEPVNLQARFAEDAAAICVWEGSGENKRLSWKSKVFVMPRPFDPVAARVDAVGYPVSLSVGTYSSPDAVPTRDHDVQVQNQSGRRLPRMRAERFLRISVESAHEIDSVVVATNLVEVN